MKGSVAPPMIERGILILEDDPDVALTIGAMLERDGWSTRHAATLTEGIAALKEFDPCIVIVDLVLPDGSGMNLVRQAAARSRTGVIVVSGQGSEMDRVVGLEVGADDYITKPFSQRELTARVRALYRRLVPDQVPASVPAGPKASHPVQARGEPRKLLTIGDTTLDPVRMRIAGPNGMTVNLTGGEAHLLSRLIEAGEEPLPREAVAEQVLGHKLLPQQRGIDQLASNLRRKLESIPDSPVKIVAVRGKGYRLIF